MVCHFVHQTVFHGFGCLRIDLVFSSWREVLRFLNLLRPDALSNSHHPKEFVYIISGVADQAAKDDKNVFNIMFEKNGIRLFFGTGHGLANSGDVGYTITRNERGSILG